MSHEPHPTTHATRIGALIVASVLWAAPTPLADAQPAQTEEPSTEPSPTAKPTQGPTRADLAGARSRLEKLTEDIEAGETGAKRLQTQLRELSYEVADEQGTLTEIGANLDTTTKKIGTTKHRLEELREQIRARARTLYKRGPTELIGVLLGAESLREFVGRFTFASTLAKQDEKLILETRKRQGELRKIQDHQKRLREQQQSTVDSLRDRQNEITDVFARQQLVLARLADARAEALELVGRLEAVLGPLEGFKRVAGRGMTISYGEWAQAFLDSIGAPVIRDNLVAVVAWEASEGTQATWNPLATTMPMPGATVYNDHGVRNYQSMRQGIEAVIKTLGRPDHGYEKILDRLERGVKAMETGKAINASDWCRGCTNGQYVIGIIPAVEKYYEDYAGEGEN
jgi:peptidoglycan hydrolase CwlO-like protein